MSDWRPASFTSHFRGQAPGPPQLGRWEAVLHVERTLTFHLLTAIARRPWLRRLFGVSADLGSACGPSLSEREARVNAMRNTIWGRRIGRAPARYDPTTVERAGQDLPPVGPLLDREIDTALTLLGNIPFEELQRRGWHLQPNHFYWPLNDVTFLRENRDLWTGSKLPSGIAFDMEGQAALVERLAKYSSELADIRRGPPERPGEVTWGQGFGGLDAYCYYGLVRDLRPSRVVEVGIGLSSLLLARAVAANGEPCEVTLVDPYPPRAVLGELPESWEVVPSLVQRVDPEVFGRLQPGDILFYDGSHCVRTGSDVNWMFFEVLPHLAPGVWIHVHDICWPMDYGKDWILDEGLSWNEQYLVQAFLMQNSSYRVRLGSVLLHHYKLSALEDLFPGGTLGASSLWLEKVA